MTILIGSGHVTSRLTIGATKSGVYLIQQLIDKAWGTRAFSATVKGKKNDRCLLTLFIMQYDAKQISKSGSKSMYLLLLQVKLLESLSIR